MENDPMEINIELRLSFNKLSANWRRNIALFALIIEEIIQKLWSRTCIGDRIRCLSTCECDFWAKPSNFQSDWRLENKQGDRAIGNLLIRYFQRHVYHGCLSLPYPYIFRTTRLDNWTQAIVSTSPAQLNTTRVIINLRSFTGAAEFIAGKTKKILFDQAYSSLLLPDCSLT